MNPIYSEIRKTMGTILALQRELFGLAKGNRAVADPGTGSLKGKMGSGYGDGKWYDGITDVTPEADESDFKVKSGRKVDKKNYKRDLHAETFGDDDE